MNGITDTVDDALRLTAVRRASYVLIVKQHKADERAAMIQAITEGMGV